MMLTIGRFSRFKNCQWIVSVYVYKLIINNGLKSVLRFLIKES